MVYGATTCDVSHICAYVANHNRCGANTEDAVRWEGASIYSFVLNIESFIQIHIIDTLTSDSIASLAVTVVIVTPQLVYCVFSSQPEQKYQKCFFRRIFHSFFFVEKFKF